MEGNSLFQNGLVGAKRHSAVEKHLTFDLAYAVEIEQAEAKINGRKDVTPFALRVTMIL